MRFHCRTLACLLLAFASGAAADDPQVNVTAGFDRKVKRDHAPIRVEIDTTDEPFDGEIRIGYRMMQPQAWVVQHAKVPAHSRFALHLCLPIDSPNRQVELLVAESNGRISPYPIDCKWLYNARLVVVIGDQIGGVVGDPGVGKPPDPAKDGANAPEALDVTNLKPRLAPYHWQAYQGLDLVILHQPEPARFEPAQVRALKRWVELGGHLAISLGTRPVTTSGTWLEDLLPCSVDGIAELTSLEEFDRKYGEEEKTPMSGTFGVARLTPVRDASIQAAQGKVVLACTGRVQGGSVTAFAFDTQSAPFLGRPSVRKLIDELGPATGAEAWEGLESDLSQSVPRRMSAAHALDWRKAAWLAGLLIVYLFLLKFLQRRLLSPPVTQRRVLVLMPAVPLGTALITALVLLCMPTGPTRMETVGIVFLHPASATGEAHVFRTLLSPRAQTVVLRFDEPDLIVDQECGANIELVFAGGYRFRQEESASLEGVTLLPAVPRTFLTTSLRTLAGPLVVRLDRSVEPWTVTIDNRTGLELHELRVAAVGEEVKVGSGSLRPGEPFEGPLPNRSPLVAAAPTTVWSIGQRSMHDTILGELDHTLELDHPAKPGEARKQAYVTAWVRLDPDWKLSAEGPVSADDDSLLVLPLPLGEENK